MEGVTIVLPSLDPDEKLNMVVQGLLAEGFHDIVIVNDGSDADHLAPFEEAAKHPEVTVLTHEVNKGKGRALKTAFSYILERGKTCLGVVTVDGDNQHKAKDIKACADHIAFKVWYYETAAKEGLVALADYASAVERYRRETGRKFAL